MDAYICEIKDSNYIQDVREKIDLFSYYNILILPGKGYSVIYINETKLVVNVYGKL